MASSAAQSRSFEKGTDYVPETGWYKLHRGERVMTAKENRTYYEGGMHGGTVTINLYDANRDDLRRELARFGL
jgi:hypothetical protein